MSAVKAWAEHIATLDHGLVATITKPLAIAAIAELVEERDKWEWVARDACRELAYETHVNPQSPLDYRLAHYQGGTK